MLVDLEEVALRGFEKNPYSLAIFYVILPIGLAPVGSHRCLLIKYGVLVGIEMSSCLTFLSSDRLIFWDLCFSSSENYATDGCER